MKKCFVLLIVLMVSSVASANGLLGYWDFEGDTADESGYGAPADLTLGAGASLGAYGGRNCLVVGSGGDGGAHAAYNAKWDDNVEYATQKGNGADRGSGITLAGWFRPNDYAAEWKPMMGFCESGWGARVFSKSSGALGDVQTDGDGWSPIEVWNGDAWNDGEWHYVVYSYDWLNETDTMWLDGLLWSQSSGGGAWWAQSTDTFCVGANLSDAGYNGYIDDVAIFSGAADQADVDALMSGAETVWTVDITSVPEPATMALLGLGLSMIRRRK